MAGKLVVAKKVKNCVLYTNGMLRVDNVIGSYPHLLKPHEGEGDDGKKTSPKYQLQGLLGKDTHAEAIDLIRSTVKKIMDEKKLTIPGKNCFFKDGDKFFEEKEECANRYVISARDEDPPTLRDENAEKLSREQDAEEIKDKFYGGAVFSILINPWFQDNKYGKKINANIKAVRFIQHGTPFGEGRVDDETAWDDDDEAWAGGDDDDDI